MSELKKAMSEKKISGKELASTINVTPVYMSFLVNGKRTPSLRLANEISRILEKPIEKLFPNN